LVQRGREPESSTRPRCSEGTSQALELRRCSPTAPHKLYFVENPQRIRVKKREWDGPTRARHSVTAQKCGRKKDILSANNDGGALRPFGPLIVTSPAHLEIHARWLTASGLEKRTAGVYPGGG